MPGKLCETAEEVPGKVWRKRTHFLPGTCYEKMKSAWGSAGVKDIFWPDTFYDKMKSACKSTEVKDLILQGTCYEKMKSA